MAERDAVNAIYEQIDTNRDGNIYKNELHQWISNAEELPSTSYEFCTTEHNFNDNISSHFDLNDYKVNCPNTSESTADKYTPYETTTVARELIDDTVVHTNSLEETNEYLERSANNIYKDPNPQIIQLATTDHPAAYEQRIFVRYLQPPAPPPPGPLIIKEVRLSQLPSHRSLCIRKHVSSLCSPSSLIFRERPPTSPPYSSNETITRYSSAIPVRPRSAGIEHFSTLPEEPRDIVTERWVSYEPRPERYTIVETAPSATKSSKPRNTIVVYGDDEARTVRQCQNLGIIQENPVDYVVRYWEPLLGSETLVQQARNAGVIEDISSSASASSIYTNTRRSTDFDQSNEIINRSFSFLGRTRRQGSQLVGGMQRINRGNTICASSVSKWIRECRAQYGFHGGDASIIAVRI
ncbi:unnamed protein product [Rotaria sp. Silwood1]|nr:unnamed protein product [Rotaria sp. Silwood1]CAF3513185.1 unnamed protein product [Rotaria sp. Silwood1]CAF4566469.1 unnamed protein product [Rotaria sp. Silwood1]CAF4863622.1 unnamed protein product [Rotaria sp. Silwood1]